MFLSHAQNLNGNLISYPVQPNPFIYLFIYYITHVTSCCRCRCCCYYYYYMHMPIIVRVYNISVVVENYLLLYTYNNLYTFQIKLSLFTNN